MDYKIHEKEGFQYIEEGKDGKQVLLLLHGLFGALSNWSDVIDAFKQDYKVIIPLLPIYSLPLLKTSVSNLAKYIYDFTLHKNIQDPVLVGNSLGGHVALLYALEHTENYKSIVLAGSSGLYENGMGGTFPKRGDYNYIKEKTELTFFDPKMASKALIDEVFETVNDRNRVIRILAMSKSAIRQNLSERLYHITKPVLLVWGKNDTVTPPSVALDFKKLLKNSHLHYIDQCGHAPMMERPQEFNTIFKAFLGR